MHRYLFLHITFNKVESNKFISVNRVLRRNKVDVSTSNHLGGWGIFINHLVDDLQISIKIAGFRAEC